MAEVAIWGYGLSAFTYLCFGLYLFFAWRGGRPGGLLILAVVVSCIWAAASGFVAHTSAAWLFELVRLLDIARGAAWFAFILVLLRPLGAGRTKWPFLAAAGVISAQLLVIAAGMVDLLPAESVVGLSIATFLMQAILGLVLVEQLFRALPSESRWGFKPLCLALGAGFMFDLYLFADGFLFSRLDPDVWAVRGVAHALLIPLVALSATRNPAWTLRMSMSREMVFHSTALVGTGVYLLVIAAAGYYVRYFGGDWGRALQLTLLFAGLVLLGVFVFSGAQRARLRVFLNKHLFPYRYDYRNEWLRFTQAISSAGDGLDLGQTVIKALSDLVESPGGGLWLRDGNGRYLMHSRLNLAVSAAIESADSPLCRFLDERTWVIDLEEYRSRRMQYQGLVLPDWLSSIADAWLVIPLKSTSGLVGFVVLNAPRARFEIDWEVLDLLKTAQRQAASYLERMQAAEALLEARKFESFNRMSAFVVHDLKNLVAQLSLMLKNAERHKHNPAFQEDMLETVAHVESRMRTLMTQLQEKRSIDPAKVVDLATMAEHVKQVKRALLPPVEVHREGAGSAEVIAHPERLERVVGHLVQNALDATPEDGKVSIRLNTGHADRVRVVVEDSGCGMSAAFLRERLARPFQTTKASGMGIGVYETQQYITELGGAIHFDSEEGRGTRVTIDLPAARHAGAGKDGAEKHVG
ncbi:PEP-CTERM system histidine kinase PrsK [Azoarcus indigens]|uniref:histidine kinase n=1 Tax=Azoarcus indigens TaxID=29545 RepID=A0A4R6DK40_9RHOO|nr:XrtA/PEP-CTERM system histidine kinase PrsK [Azoarcus indigens]NMG67208.1 PEP-CTERM system histidine kinase PrsK [Azoarcus indigens]TDN44518.1 hypothetical protein C7389_13432 [Azoarcus indigens]